MAAQLTLKGPLTSSQLHPNYHHRWRRGEHLAAPRSVSSKTIREMAEGFSPFKPGCTVQINEGIVSISELMGVKSEAPRTDPENENAQDKTRFTGERLLSLA